MTNKTIFQKELTKLDSERYLEDILIEKDDLTFEDFIDDEDIYVEEVKLGNWHEEEPDRIVNENELKKAEHREKRLTAKKHSEKNKKIAKGAITKANSTKQKPKYKYRERTTKEGIVSYVTKRTKLDNYKKLKLKNKKRSERKKEKETIKSYTKYL